MYPNGDIYIGTFLHSLRHGEGEYTATSGLFYNGSWIDDKRHGFGDFRNKLTGMTYSGYWVNDVREGEGTMTSNKETYSGSFVKGVFEGHGIYEDINGVKYEGSFFQGRFHGTGKMIKGNETYVGDWSAGKFDGQGLRQLTNGARYFGAFAEGFYDGVGEMVYASDNSSYNGEWKKGLRHGVGIFNCGDSSGLSLQGHWETDAPLLVGGTWHVTWGSENDRVEYIGGLIRDDLRSFEVTFDGLGVVILSSGKLETFWARGVQKAGGIWRDGDTGRVNTNAWLTRRDDSRLDVTFSEHQLGEAVHIK